jgi:methyltransferase OMS1, mitochondrial
MGSLPSSFINDSKPLSVVGDLSLPEVRQGWIWIGGLAGFCIALYCTQVYQGWKAAWKKSESLELQQDADVSDRYDKIAEQYDDDVNWMENLMLLPNRRRQMCQMARGHVLEVSVGTGRNTRYYDLGVYGEGVAALFKQVKPKAERVKSLTLVDQSEKMLDFCYKRWRKLQPHFKGLVMFVEADAGEEGAVKPPGGSGGFDTIIQTFGLCSMTDPVEYMKTIGKLLKKPGPDSAEGGRIFLLEHGRGHYWWINYVLDGMAKEHADRFGCWWNRDIGKIVEESGLKVTKLKRYHFGTTWALELTHVESQEPQEHSASEGKKTT